MNDLPKMQGTSLHDIADKVKIPEKVPIPPRVFLSGVPPINATTSILDDIFLWFRNRLKRMASQEGQGVDAGNLLPSVPKLLNIAGILSQWYLWIGLAVILVILFALKVL